MIGYILFLLAIIQAALIYAKSVGNLAASWLVVLLPVIIFILAIAGVMLYVYIILNRKD